MGKKTNKPDIQFNTSKAIQTERARPMDTQMFPVFQTKLLLENVADACGRVGGLPYAPPQKEEAVPTVPREGWPPEASPGLARVLFVAPKSQLPKGGQDRAGPPLSLASVGPESGVGTSPTESETRRGRTLTQHVTRSIMSDIRVSLQTCRSTSVFDQPLLLCRKSRWRGSF